MDNKGNISPLGPNNGKKLPEDKLLAYLEGKLTPQEQHEVELWMADEGMESDALEGLSTIKTSETRQSVLKINSQLKNSLPKKKGRRRPQNPGQSTIIAIGIIIFLSILAYYLLRISINGR